MGSLALGEPVPSLETGVSTSLESPIARSGVEAASGSKRSDVEDPSQTASNLDRLAPPLSTSSPGTNTNHGSGVSELLQRALTLKEGNDSDEIKDGERTPGASPPSLLRSCSAMVLSLISKALSSVGTHSPASTDLTAVDQNRISPVDSLASRPEEFSTSARSSRPAASRNNSLASAVSTIPSSSSLDASVDQPDSRSLIQPSIFRSERRSSSFAAFNFAEALEPAVPADALSLEPAATAAAQPAESLASSRLAWRLSNLVERRREPQPRKSDVLPSAGVQPGLLAAVKWRERDAKLGRRRRWWWRRNWRRKRRPVRLHDDDTSFPRPPSAASFAHFPDLGSLGWLLDWIALLVVFVFALVPALREHGHDTFELPGRARRRPRLPERRFARTAPGRLELATVSSVDPLSIRTSDSRLRSKFGLCRISRRDVPRRTVPSRLLRSSAQTRDLWSSRRILECALCRRNDSSSSRSPFAI